MSEKAAERRVSAVARCVSPVDEDRPAGHEGSIVVQRVKDMNGDEGFNAQTEQYENLVKAGVIDPVKVVRSALQNAASIASLLLTTEAVISQEATDDKAGAAAHSGGAMGGGMY